jgi:hypothetical protein
VPAGAACAHVRWKPPGPRVPSRLKCMNLKGPEPAPGARHHHRTRRAEGKAALVLTSPPYGRWTHGHVRTDRETPDGKVVKTHACYGTDRANLAHRPMVELLDGFAHILTGCATLLRPGGVVAVTVRPFRLRGELIDLPGQTISAAERAGLVLVDRFAALLCALRNGRVVTRASFFQMLETRRLHDQGICAAATAHEDLLVFEAVQDRGRLR